MHAELPPTERGLTDPRQIHVGQMPLRWGSGQDLPLTATASTSVPSQHWHQESPSPTTDVPPILLARTHLSPLHSLHSPIAWSGPSHRRTPKKGLGKVQSMFSKDIDSSGFLKIDQMNLEHLSVSVFFEFPDSQQGSEFSSKRISAK